MNYSLHFFNYHLWCYSLHTGMISSPAGFIAKYWARATCQVELYCIQWVLSHPIKPGIRMGRSPDRNYWYIDQRSQMHIGRIHGYHEPEFADDIHFLLQTYSLFHRNSIFELLVPLTNQQSFRLGSTKKIQTIWLFVKMLYYLLEAIKIVHLAIVFGKGSKADGNGELGIGNWELGIRNWELGIGRYVS